MVVKLKPWNEVANEAQHRGEYNYISNRAFGIDKNSLAWGNWVYSDAPDEEGDYFVAHSRWVHSYMVEEVKNNYDETPDPDDILRYGKIVTDDQMHTISVEVDRRPVTGDVRIRLISYGGMIWYHKMVDGEVVDFHKVGYPYD